MQVSCNSLTMEEGENAYYGFTSSLRHAIQQIPSITNICWDVNSIFTLKGLKSLLSKFLNFTNAIF